LQVRRSKQKGKEEGRRRGRNGGRKEREGRKKITFGSLPPRFDHCIRRGQPLLSLVPGIIREIIKELRLLVESLVGHVSCRELGRGGGKRRGGRKREGREEGGRGREESVCSSRLLWAMYPVSLRRRARRGKEGSSKGSSSSKIKFVPIAVLPLVIVTLNFEFTKPTAPGNGKTTGTRPGRENEEGTRRKVKHWCARERNRTTKRSIWRVCVPDGTRMV
jgi:hypothetical protein